MITFNLQKKHLSTHSNYQQMPTFIKNSIKYIQPSNFRQKIIQFSPIIFKKQLYTSKVPFCTKNSPSNTQFSPRLTDSSIAFVSYR